MGQTIHSMSVALFVPSIKCSFTCIMSLHIDQAYQKYYVGICSCTACNVSCAFQVTSERCIRHKVNRAWLMVTTRWLLPPQSTELLLIPLAVWTHGEQLMGFCLANEIKRVSAV